MITHTVYAASIENQIFADNLLPRLELFCPPDFATTCRLFDNRSPVVRCRVTGIHRASLERLSSNGSRGAYPGLWDGCHTVIVQRCRRGR